MSPRTYLALDLGTSSVKALVVDRAGKVLWSKATGGEGTTWIGINGDVGPEHLWQETCKLVRAATAAVGPVDAVGVTAQLAVVLVDNDLVPTFPMIPWSDRRAQREAAALSGQLGDRVAMITGRRVASELMAPRLVWLRDADPGAYERTSVALTLKDFIVARLTGRALTDATSASYTMLYDVARRAWSDELVKACDLEPRLLPEVLDAGALAGTVTEQAAMSTGLQAGAPVAAGGPDGSLGAAGAGAVEAGVTVDVTGTTDTIVRSVGAPLPATGHRGVVVNAFIRPDLWAIGGPTGMTGGALGWIARLAGKSSVSEFYVEWADRIDALPSGADGVVFITTLTGDRFPSWRDDRLGGIEGLRAHHSLAHLARAAEEGAACLVAAGLASLAEVGQVTEELRFVGGGARSGRAAQLRADICGVAVMIMENHQASALGAAMAAAVASNGCRDWSQAAAQMVRVKARVDPGPSATSQARETFERWARSWRAAPPGPGTPFAPAAQSAQGSTRRAP